MRGGHGRLLGVRRRGTSSGCGYGPRGPMRSPAGRAAAGHGRRYRASPASRS
ncbi:hypothetical protein SGM_1300 [Streptomyces griseoaurantiacus M045]|uniref:Uncharacterized protein n=1 Tax=Streptomyces griseoaurantiacus M045 TaxID=996637 RepID=F3NDT6_9ACTN|nr:hypothetical protein SGM_1300 [Streptomyces griseoaurantiacus M045]